MVAEGAIGCVPLVSKVTFLVDFTHIALLVFKMDVGVLVAMDDRDETDDPAVAIVGDCFGC